MPRANRFAVVGRPLPRLDAPAKVTGSQIYGTDVALPGMLWGKLLRSPVPSAAIRRLDPRPALAIDGVRAVIAAADIPSVRYGPAVKDMSVLARDRVRYVEESRSPRLPRRRPRSPRRRRPRSPSNLPPLPAVFDLRNGRSRPRRRCCTRNGRSMAPCRGLRATATSPAGRASTTAMSTPALPKPSGRL